MDHQLTLQRKLKQCYIAMRNKINLKKLAGGLLAFDELITIWAFQRAYVLLTTKLCVRDSKIFVSIRVSFRSIIRVTFIVCIKIS